VVISRRLVAEDKFTSVHIEEFEVSVRDTALGAEEITRDLDNVSEEKLRYLDETGIIQIGVNVKAGDILVGKTTPSSEGPMSSEEKLLKAIFGDKITQKRNTSLCLPSGTFGTVVDVEILTRRGDLKDQRALQIEREAILKREMKKNIELSILHDTFDKSLNSLLDGCIVNLKGKRSKIASSDLKKMSLENKFTLSANDNNISKKLLELRNTYLTAKKKIEELYILDVEKLMDGDNLLNGILKIVKVYVAVK
jgi:DNA-directed RNA polymerase subunit beta